MPKQRVSKSDEFHNWLLKRVRSSVSGGVVDPETSRYVQIANARARTLIAITDARGQYQRDRFKQSIEQQALDQARADRSDSFVYNRVLSHLRSGVAGLDSYSVDFRKEEVEVGSTDNGGTTITMIRHIAMNQKVL